MAEPKMLPYVEKWEKELGAPLNEQQKEKILRLVCSTSIDIGTREMHFKYLARWYIKP